VNPAGSIPDRLGQKSGRLAVTTGQVREFCANAELEIAWHRLRIASADPTDA
jgi:hypothetical protein